MKTKLRHFTLAFVALLIVGFASCSNEDGPEVDNPAETQSVFLKISNGPSTRAEGPTQAGDPVVFESGHLYFTDTDGNILRYHSIGEGKDYTVAQLTKTGDPTGVEIKNLNASVTDVYIVGNYTAEGTSAIPKSGNISAVKAHLLKVEDQKQTTAGNIVNLYGTGTITGTETKTVTVHLAPTVARMELTDITAKGRITSFKVSGVYIDRFHTQAQVDGTVDNNYVAASTSASDYEAESTKYPTTLQGAVYDSKVDGWGAISKIAKPAGTNHVWGYNLFAGIYDVNNPSNSVGVDTPNIVIRLTDIEVSEGVPFADPQFITIKNSAITKIKPGHVYNIAADALKFDETNLTAAPNEVTMDVEVTVTLAEWIPVNFIPEL